MSIAWQIIFNSKFKKIVISLTDNFQTGICCVSQINKHELYACCSVWIVQSSSKCHVPLTRPSMGTVTWIGLWCMGKLFPPSLKVLTTGSSPFFLLGKPLRCWTPMTNEREAAVKHAGFLFSWLHCLVAPELVKSVLTSSKLHLICCLLPPFQTGMEELHLQLQLGKVSASVSEAIWVLQCCLGIFGVPVTHDTSTSFWQQVGWTWAIPI